MAVDEQGNQIIEPVVSDAEKRIKDLSGKVKDTATERDAAMAAQKAAEEKAAAAEKKAMFAEGFVDVVAGNPAAKEHKADIEAKVMAGYSVQDATYAVLGPLGKLGAPAIERMPTAAGGSSATQITGNTAKAVNDMTSAELRAQLVEAQNRGDLYLS
jgi:hypothetical protein